MMKRGFCASLLLLVLFSFRAKAEEVYVPDFNPGDYYIEWEPSYSDPYGRSAPTNIRHAKGCCQQSGARLADVTVTHRHKVQVLTYSDLGVAANTTTTTIVG